MIVEQTAITPNDTQSQETVQAWRQLLVRGILRTTAILGFFVLVIVTCDVYLTGYPQVIPLYLLAYALVALAAFAPGATFHLQTGVLLLLLYSIGFMDTSMYGMSGTGGIFWLTFSVTAIFLLGLRWGILALIISFLSYFGFGIAISFKLIYIPAETLDHDNLDLMSWLSSSLVLTTLGTALIICFNYLFRHLITALTKSQELARELTVDIVKRKTVEEALEKREQEFKTLVNNNPDLMMRFDRQYRLLYVNPAVEKEFGVPLQSALSKTGRELGQPGDEADELEAKVQQIFESGQEIALEMGVRRKGQTKHYLARGVPEFDSAGSVISALVILHNITERKQRERELQTIATLSAAMRMAPTRAEMEPAILDQVSRLLDADGVALELVDPATGDAIIEVALGIWSEVTGSRIPRGQGLNSYILASGKPYLNNNVLDDSMVLFPKLFADVHSVGGVPLVAEGQPIGFLWVGRKTDIVESEVRLLCAIADIAANAIHRATLHETTLRDAQNLAALHAIDSAISGSTELRVTAGIVLNQVRARLTVDAADVLVLNPYLNVLEYVAGNGFRSQAIAQTQVRVGEGQAGKAILERSTIHIPNLATVGNAFSRADLLSGDAFVAYWVVPLIAKGQVKGALEIFHRAPFTPDEGWFEFLETLAGQAAIAIDNAELFQSLQRSNIELAQAYDATIEGWSRALDLRDRETEGHTQRVTELTLQLARAMHVGNAELVHIRRGALLHDIGKMGVPDSILLKHGSLTETEWEIMRKHPAHAFEMLAPIAYLLPALDIPYCHHEKWDGTGYPRGLRGNSIPLTARLFAVVDVWDAMCSDRPYRPALSKDAAREYISTQAGRHFDPQVVQVFLKLVGDK